MQIDINFSPLSLIIKETNITLSQIVPILNDIGLELLYEEKKDKETIFYICHDCCLNDLKTNYKNVLEIIKSVLKGQTPSCKLLSLCLTQNFSLREINLFRTFMRYENQLVLEFNISTIVDILSKNHTISKMFLSYFYTKFVGEKFDDELIYQAFKSISSHEDKILKLFFEIIKNTTKTNYFKNKDAISIKINTKNLHSYLKGIQPNLEMFVFHKDFSGIHLRMSPVSRGGLRYSNRQDDFRVEIKSLMATQEGKNAIIVPSGAKGGFVIRKSPLSKEDFTEIYKTFIDAMLDLIDEDDNYFVVAADKGTSNMSDVANQVAIKRGYWLKDAFASGGSKGYSHKKLGITAKGAIKTVQRYFIENGVDIYKTPIKVVGIGSMGGDVFGNGLLETKNFLLVGAISHDEVFIDPNPDIEKSYNERKRLFNSKKHKWSDYDTSFLSNGGLVVKRSQSEVQLPQKTKDFLGISKDTPSGEEIAQALLKLDVDMIYNGGVGTYFKASSETNLEVADKENEYVRIDANQIKAKAVCEGGNLGFTQKARYEYALNGGFINLDSIDNSAGVNTSDHEVNLKILLDGENKRDEILKSLEEWVVKTVLKDNYLQSLAISLDKKRSKEFLDRFLKTIHVLENNLSVFERRYFYIPHDKQFDLMLDSKESIIRPLLAVLLLYSKIFLKNILSKSRFIEDEIFFKRYLFNYFPDDLKLLYEDKILKHPLKKEIIITVVANKIINYQGASFIYDFYELGEEKFLQKIKAYLMIDELFNIDNKRDLENYERFLSLEKEMETSVRWLLQNFEPSELNFEHLLNYKDEIEKEDFDISSFKFALGAIQVQKVTNTTYQQAIMIVCSIVKTFDITLLLNKIDKLIVKDPNKELVKSQLEELLEGFVIKISQDIISKNTTIKEYLKQNDFDMSGYHDRIEDIKQNETYSIYQIVVLVNSLLLI